MVGFRPKYITFDCYGTLINFQMSTMTRTMFADRIDPDRMQAFTTDAPVAQRPGGRVSRGCAAPAEQVRPRESTRAPVPAGAGCIDHEPGLGRGGQRSKALSPLRLPGAEGAAGDHVSGGSCGALGPGEGVLVALPAAGPRASRGQGGPPRG